MDCVLPSELIAKITNDTANLLSKGTAEAFQAQERIRVDRLATEFDEDPLHVLVQALMSEDLLVLERYLPKFSDAFFAKDQRFRKSFETVIEEYVRDVRCLRLLAERECGLAEDMLYLLHDEGTPVDIPVAYQRAWMEDYLLVETANLPRLLHLLQEKKKPRKKQPDIHRILTLTAWFYGLDGYRLLAKHFDNDLDFGTRLGLFRSDMKRGLAPEESIFYTPTIAYTYQTLSGVYQPELGFGWHGMTISGPEFISHRTRLIWRKYLPTPEKEIIARLIESKGPNRKVRFIMNIIDQRLSNLYDLVPPIVPHVPNIHDDEYFYEDDGSYAIVISILYTFNLDLLRQRRTEVLAYLPSVNEHNIWATWLKNMSLYNASVKDGVEMLRILDRDPLALAVNLLGHRDMFDDGSSCSSSDGECVCDGCPSGHDVIVTGSECCSHETEAKPVAANTFVSLPTYFLTRMRSYYAKHT